MIGYLVEVLITGIAVFIVARILPNVEVKDFPTALLAAFVFSILKVLLGGLLTLVFLPLLILTLWLFSFVINAFLLWLTSRLIDGFKVEGIVATILAAFLLAVIDTGLGFFIPDF